MNHHAQKLCDAINELVADVEDNVNNVIINNTDEPALTEDDAETMIRDALDNHDFDDDISRHLEGLDPNDGLDLYQLAHDLSDHLSSKFASDNEMTDASQDIVNLQLKVEGLEEKVAKATEIATQPRSPALDEGAAIEALEARVEHTERMIEIICAKSRGFEAIDFLLKAIKEIAQLDTIPPKEEEK